MLLPLGHRTAGVNRMHYQTESRTWKPEVGMGEGAEGITGLKFLLRVGAEVQAG